MPSTAKQLWNRWFGDRGERAAERALKRKGLKILTRNYRVAAGEIDIVALDRGVIVFVEVKTRVQGEPAEAVTLEKQRRITRAALWFLKRHGLLETARCRFDVVAVVWPAGAKRPTIDHFVNDFEAVGPWQMFL